MNTRFNYDADRTRKSLEESTYIGRYLLNTPGPGVNLPYMEDSQVRLQKWGANLMKNPVDLETDLRGMTRKMNRDLVGYNNHNVYTNTGIGSIASYPVHESFVAESRATHPAWIYRSMEHPRWEEPIINPQANLEKPFHDMINTRILEKDYHVPRIPIVVMSSSSSSSDSRISSSSRSNFH
jgi:hypothetical protein